MANSIFNQEWAFRSTCLRGQMIDVSIGGMAFVVPEPIDAGSLLSVELRHSRREVAVVRRVFVVGCQPEGENSWRVLCQFVQRLSFEEVTRLSLEPTA